jgi:hypothetical protein
MRVLVKKHAIKSEKCAGQITCCCLVRLELINTPYLHVRWNYKIHCVAKNQDYLLNVTANELLLFSGRAVKLVLAQSDASSMKVSIQKIQKSSYPKHVVFSALISWVNWEVRDAQHNMFERAQ